jgi:capsular polysaccharide biosynthesis protein
VTIGEFWFILRRRFALLAVFFVLPILGAAAYSYVTPTTYESTVSAFVSTPSSGEELGVALQGSQFAQQRAASYALLARTEVVTAPVISSLGLDMTPEQMAREITTEVPLDSVLINITVEDGSAEQAAAIANGVGEELVSAVTTLESRTGSTSPVVVTLVQPASAADAPTSPDWPLNLAIGVVAGIALGIAAALIGESVANARRRPSAPRSVDARTGADVTGDTIGSRS